MTDVTPESILDVKFREKVRGYHPADVDAFVSRMSSTVGELQQRVKAAEANAAEGQSGSGQGSEVEESLRRTLVLAQRTADLAIQEAREQAASLVAEAQEQHDSVLSDAAELRARMHAEVETEVRAERDRLEALRDALAADVEALQAHLERERERLRIYFNDQLRRLEEGQPGLAPRPPLQAPLAPERAPDADSAAGGEPAPQEQGPFDVEDDAAAADGPAEEDPFLAELRRAVTDDEPLGPRDTVPSDSDDSGFDLFAPGGEEPSRFGGRRRRRREG